LDKHIVGQMEAKKAVAIALRKLWPDLVFFVNASQGTVGGAKSYHLHRQTK